ncbi:hypothetical protein ACFSTH_19900 [Paenibacillus yanchengensis]|uniref:Uncharacterized protein n=1 Tax=Paenibacillus yanchengensis TaxID=2035833 RepID=A0ABW4YN61_9BACL
MGVRHAREYADILQELTKAVSEIEECYTFFEMELADWQQLATEEQSEVMEALADDIFFGLGTVDSIVVGRGTVIHNAKRHLIEVVQDDKIVQIVRLI